jgi:hypothetical protein
MHGCIGLRLNLAGQSTAMRAEVATPLFTLAISRAKSDVAPNSGIKIPALGRDLGVAGRSGDLGFLRLDSFVNLFAMDCDVGGRVNAYTNLISFDTEDSHFDGIGAFADDEGFAGTTGENQHGGAPFPWWVLLPDAAFSQAA